MLAAAARASATLATARGSMRCVSVVALLGLAACKQPTALTLTIAEPTNALLDPFKESVSDYVLKAADGSIVAAVSAGASLDSSGRLGLGALSPSLAGDLQLDLMSGAQLVGVGRLANVSIANGKTTDFEADVRKPLVVVGAAAAPEGPGTLAKTQLLDSTTSTNLATQLSVPAATAAGFTADGKTLLVTSGKTLSTFDTGTGSAGSLTTLPFSPALLAIAPADHGLALVERAATSRILIYAEVDALLADPTIVPLGVSITAGLPRAAHFSPSGQILYVLVEASGSEPCTGALPATNAIVPISLTGAVGPAIALPGYVADFAVAADGGLVLADVGSSQIEVMTLGTDGMTAMGPATKLYTSGCPTAIRLIDDEVFAVTNDTSATITNGFSFLHGKLDGSAATLLPIARPTYQTQLNTNSTRDKLTELNLQFTGKAVAASEMALAPDGSHAVFATRTRYQEDGSSSFMFAGLACMATVDIVEYGVYSVDLTVGTSAYTARSQSVVLPTDPTNTACVVCTATLDGPPPVSLTLQLFCPPTPGDRAAGLASAFSELP